MRIGIIGCGQLGRIHAHAYAGAGAQIAWTADTDEMAARALAAEYSSQWTDSFVRLLKDESLAGISLCVPTHLHFPILKAALEYGKSVLCEKPLTTTLAEAHELVRLAADKSAWIQVGYMKRFDPAIRAAWEALTQIGAIQSAQFRSYLPFTPAGWERAKQRWIVDQARSGGGALVHSGSHTLDMALWFCGPIISVASQVQYKPDLPEIDYSAQALLWNAELRPIYLDVAWLPLTGIGHRHDGWDEVFTVTGEKGIIQVRTSWWSQFETGRTVLQVYTETDRSSQVSSFGPPDYFTHEIAAFLKSLKLGEPPQVSLREGVQVQILIDAIFKSSREGRRLDVEQV